MTTVRDLNKEYRDTDIELGTLLGWTNIRPINSSSSFQGVPPGHSASDYLPRWSTDPSYAIKLIESEKINTTYTDDEQTVIAYYPGIDGFHCEKSSDHNSGTLALIFSIAKAAIIKLKHQKGIK